MTRPYENTLACIMANPIKQSRKNGSGGNYPLWMRTLEEKYQKLHKKITENTSGGYGRFNSCVGRSVYDARLSQALLRYKDQGVYKTADRSRTTQKQTVTNNCIQVIDLCNKDQVDVEQDQYLDDEINFRNSEKTVGNCEPIENSRTMSPRSTGLHLPSTSDIHNDEDEHATEEFVEITDLNGDGDNCIVSQNSVNGKSEMLTQEEKAKLNESKRQPLTGTQLHSIYSRKNLKTSVSRISKTTTKSCPAKIQSKTLEKPASQIRLLHARSKSASGNEKMITTTMSEEAKHAITETIHEMTASAGPYSKIRPEQPVEFIPSPGRKCVKSWGMNRKTKSFLDINNLAENSSQYLDDLQCDRVNGPDDNDKISCHSSAGSILEERSTSRLPDILTGSARDRGSGRNSSYRLPGIGKYDITQDEPVFEITPPGFDSRYNDVTIVEDRESETPPPDIRQRAIDKCSEWLIKYNK